MTTINIIAAVDEAGGLGLNNKLLCHLPADLQHFKATTLGKPILMGRTTFESIGRTLPGRLNVVLSRTIKDIDGAMVFNSLETALQQLDEIPELFIIGGAQLYAQTLSLANRIYLTRIHNRFEADTFFPVIDETLWYCQNREFRRQDAKNQYDMTFCIYDRKASYYIKKDKTVKQIKINAKSV
ncbi:MAG: dihydrofolate reductase [Gammaproteobacteria bacterium]